LEARIEIKSVSSFNLTLITEKAIRSREEPDKKGEGG